MGLNLFRYLITLLLVYIFAICILSESLSYLSDVVICRKYATEIIPFHQRESFL